MVRLNIQQKYLATDLQSFTAFSLKFCLFIIHFKKLNWYFVLHEKILFLINVKKLMI